MAERTASELMKAAEQGDAEACFLVGCGLTHGEQGFARDTAAARTWLLKSAELSPAHAAEIAMWIIGGDEPFERDEALAVSMLRSAAAQGEPNARCAYARLGEDPASARETFLDLASSGPTFSWGVDAASSLLGMEEANAYRQWAIHQCKDVQKRRAALERRTDTKAPRGFLAWRAPWL